MRLRYLACAFLLIASSVATGCFCCHPCCGHGHHCCYADAAPSVPAAFTVANPPPR